jgi:hypothetical protein
MIKDVSNEKLRYKFGHLSISVDEILKILEEKGISSVTAKNKSIEFGSIEDIKSHKSLFSGGPTIYLENAIISFEKGWHSVSTSYKNPSDTSMVKSLYEELIVRKSFFDNYIEFKLFRFRYFFPILIYGFFRSEITHAINLSSLALHVVDGVYLLYVFLVWVKFMLEGYSHFFRDSVYYKPTQGFFRRNSDTLAVSAITGIVGIIIGALGPSLADKIKLFF